MKVKIGDQVFDSKDQPIMVVLSQADKRNIENMTPDATMYASFPDDFGTSDQMLAWMDVEA